MQMEGDYRPEFFSGAHFCAPHFLKVGDQAIKSAVLAEEEDFVFAAKIVIEVGGRQVGSGGDFAHTGLGEAARAELASGGAEDFEAAGEIAALEAGGAHGDRMALGDVGVNEK